MTALGNYLPLLHVRPVLVPSWSFLSAADLLCTTFLLLLFFRALAAQGLSRTWQTAFFLLALGQAGLAQAVSASQGLGVLLLGAWFLGFGLAWIERGPPEQAYLSLALAMPLLALFGAFGLSLAMVSFPAALYLRRPRERRSLAADALLAGFPLACTLLALAFLTWMTTGRLAAMPLQDASAITSLSHPWAKLMGGRFVAPLFVFAILLLVAAPAQLTKGAQAARIFSLVVAAAGAFASFLDALPVPMPVFIVGAISALLVPVATNAAKDPAKAALGLAAAMCGSWLLVLAGAHAEAPLALPVSLSRDSLIGSFAPAQVAGAWGVRETFARAHPGRVPRLKRQGAEFVYVLDE